MKLPKRVVSQEGIFCPSPHPVAGGEAAVNNTIKQKVTRVQSDKGRSSTEHCRE